MKSLLTLVVLLASCGGSATAPSTPAPPVVNSPQTQVANIDKTLADAINASVKTAIALRDQVTVSQANVTVIESWATSAATLDDQIATELGSADPWATQKTKILLLLPGLHVPATGGVSATLQVSLAAVETLIAQIQAQVIQ